MKFNWTIRREVKVVSILVALFLLIAFSERSMNDVVCKNIVIDLNNVHENHFVDEEEIYNVVVSTEQKLIGNNIENIDLREIESKLMADRQVANAEMFSDLKGNLVVHVELRRPIARIVRQDGPDAYITEDGSIIPVSEKYTSRVLLLSGSKLKEYLKFNQLNETEEGTQLFDLIKFIQANKFWKAQVAQLDIDSKGKIKVYPQVTGQLVEFGYPVDIATKFKKLMIFYKEILPQRGWTKYDRVNLEYEGQIIAE